MRRLPSILPLWDRFQVTDSIPDLLTPCRRFWRPAAAPATISRISQGLRTPQKQAEYYCQWDKRPPAKIDAAANSLEHDGAPWLASLLRSYRDFPRTPHWLTSQLPGSGWHQWGLAADCYCYRNGHMVSNGSDPAYKFYADEAIKLGLTAGYYFGSQDSGHVQGPSAPGATSVYTWAFIDQTMKERFGDKEMVALSMGPAVVAMAAASPGGFYKDDPALIAARVPPDQLYKLPTQGSMLRAMAQTYNDVGGLVERLADQLGLDPVAVLAVWYVESGGRSFTPNRPVLRLENHKFFKYWGRQNQASFDEHFQFGGHNGVPGSSSRNHKYRRSGEWLQSHIAGANNQDREYDALALATDLGGREAACLSSSFGGPQVMGFNHSVCGYASAADMADAFGASPRWQILAFYDFCRSNDLIDEIQRLDWIEFGNGYNGDGSTYGPKLAAAYAQKSALLALPRQ